MNYYRYDFCTGMIFIKAQNLEKKCYFKSDTFKFNFTHTFSLLQQWCHENDGDWLKIAEGEVTATPNIVRKGLKGITFITLT